MARSATGTTVVGSLEVLLSGSGSGVAPGSTVAVLVTPPSAPVVTFTVTVMAGKLAPLASGPLAVQVIVPVVSPQVQLVPAADTKVRPEGNTSVTVNGPAALDGPSLPTRIV